MPFIDTETIPPLNGDLRLEEDKAMPIAIVGVGGRFPGDAANPEKLWELLSQGRSALSEVPKDRFNIDAFIIRMPIAQGHRISAAPTS